MVVQGWAPLHSAVSAGHDDVVQRLLSAGAEVGVVTSGGQTPLHYAVRRTCAARRWYVELVMHCRDAPRRTYPSLRLYISTMMHGWP